MESQSFKEKYGYPKFELWSSIIESVKWILYGAIIQQQLWKSTELSNLIV